VIRGISGLVLLLAAALLLFTAWNARANRAGTGKLPLVQCVALTRKKVRCLNATRNADRWVHHARAQASQLPRSK
jgi:hypothetical protein